MLVMRVGRGIRLAHDSPLAGSATNVSLLTSRQPPQSFEICSNWAAIQSAAASIPCPGGSAVSILVSVLRVPKPTSVLIVSSMLEGSMVTSAFKIEASAGAGPAAFPCRWKSGCAAHAVTTNTRPNINAIARKIMLGSPPAKVVLFPRCAPLDRRQHCISNYEYHPKIVESCHKVTASQTLKHEISFRERERGGCHAHLPRMRE